MNLLDFSEEDIENLKSSLKESGAILEKKKINSYDTKFFENVTISNTLIKIFLFFCLGLYVVINITGLVLSIIYNKDNASNPIIMVVGIFFICFIVFAIFRNINTNKKKEEQVIYIKDDNFIFNFTNGIVETPNLFYSLPYDSIQKIEFLIYSLRKKQIFGTVTFTFNLLDYEVVHIIKYTNLTKIEQMLKIKFPSLLNNLIVDGKYKKDREQVKDEQSLKYMLISFAIFVLSALLIIIPIVFNYFSMAIIISGIILLFTAIVVFLSRYFYTYFLNQSFIMSTIFMIIGFCVPLFIIECSGITFINYIIQDAEILMATIFGIIGLSIYMYSFIVFINKIHYTTKHRKDIY